MYTQPLVVTYHSNRTSTGSIGWVEPSYSHLLFTVNCHLTPRVHCLCHLGFSSSFHFKLFLDFFDFIECMFSMVLWVPPIQTSSTGVGPPDTLSGSLLWLPGVQSCIFHASFESSVPQSLCLHSRSGKQAEVHTVLCATLASGGTVSTGVLSFFACWHLFRAWFPVPPMIIHYSDCKCIVGTGQGFVSHKKWAVEEALDMS